MFKGKDTKKIVNSDYVPVFQNIANVLTEEFKGEVENNKVKFPKELGEEHPFDFKQLETLYKKFAFFTAVIDKYVDFVIGPGFFIECEDDRVKEIIENFMRDVNFDTLLRAWCKEGLIKGNGFIEIGGNKNSNIEGLKVLNANYMYVLRDKKGRVEGYNQYKGAFDKFSKEKVIPFKSYEIAHFPFNKIADGAYGLGIGYTALKMVDNLLQQEGDLHMIMNRKANSPIHAKLGHVSDDTKIIPKPEDVTAFGKELEYLNNKQEWATDALVDLKVLDFGNIGDKFNAVLEHDLNMLIYAFQIPAVILGKANIPEGLAKVQMDAFQRRIQSIQAEMEKIIEENIFKRILQANGYGDVHVEFQWGEPSSMALDSRINLVSELIKAPSTSPILKNMLEKEMVQLLKLDLGDYEKMKNEEEERMREEQRAQPLVPGQNDKFPQKPQPPKERPPQPAPQEMLKKKIKEAPKKSINKNKNVEEIVRKVGNEWCVFSHQTGKNFGCYSTKAQAEKRLAQIKRFAESYEVKRPCSCCQEKIENINDINEWLGFSYARYLSYIKQVLSKEQFNFLKATTEAELDAGYLTESQTDKLKNILDEGFTKGLSIRQMRNKVDEEVGLKDLYRMKDANTIELGKAGLPIMQISAERRSDVIVRSEVSRVANQGAVDYFKDNGFKKIQHITSISDRTCEECMALDNAVYEIGKEPGLPVHPNCRCTYMQVEE